MGIYGEAQNEQGFIFRSPSVGVYTQPSLFTMKFVGESANSQYPTANSRLLPGVRDAVSVRIGPGFDGAVGHQADQHGSGAAGPPRARADFVMAVR